MGLPAAVIGLGDAGTLAPCVSDVVVAEYREALPRPAVAPSKPVTVRLPLSDIEHARVLAEKRGLGYQTRIEILLNEAIQRERRKASWQSAAQVENLRRPRTIGRGQSRLASGAACHRA